eukprot:scaffold6420_cov168-Amphora_coffeaeformis.AAC.18
MKERYGTIMEWFELGFRLPRVSVRLSLRRYPRGEESSCYPIEKQQSERWDDTRLEKYGYGMELSIAVIAAKYGHQT